ncbi:Clavata3/ESR [Sesbania bispinosa]|nr:Clavata3/ESR [Sesbania bispinosa]
MIMKQFHLFLLLSILLFLTPTSHAIRSKFSGPSSSSSQQLFHPWANSPISSRGREFESQKRRVPTGSNPLHNKR